MTATTPQLFGQEFTTNPWPSLATLRRTDPVHHTVTPDGARIWVLTRYTDVRAALNDPRLSVDKKHARQLGCHGHSTPEVLDRHLLNTDPPDHTRIRRIITRAFTSARLAQLHARLDTLVDQLLDQLPGDEPVDLIPGLAEPLAITVVCDLLGISPTDQVDVRQWTASLLEVDPDAAVRSRAALAEMYQVLLTLLQRPATGDTLLATLQAAQIRRELTRDESIGALFLLLFSGYDTMVSALGHTLAALLAHPDQLILLRSGKAHISAAVEEAMRWCSPYPWAVRRFAVEDIEIGGVRITAGERVWPSLAAANRDPERFPSPDHFDILRVTTGHLGFGHGPHHCVAAALARLQTHQVVTNLLRRFPQLALAVPYHQLPRRASWRSPSLLALPVTGLTPFTA